MAFFTAIANRKGGVGKSTITVMLAHALAVWGGKRVLILDLDSQCNTSLILLGGQGWNTARLAKQSIADYFFDQFEGNIVVPKDYLTHSAGDVAGAGGKPPSISILPGSLLLEDVQGELYLMKARESRDPEVVANHVRQGIARLLRKFEGSFDVVLLDCPPGLSFAALAALKIADRVLVPFRPDYVSELAVDRISLIIEDKRTQDELDTMPFDSRRYVCLANYVRDNGRDKLLIEEIGLKHPMLATRLPMRDGIANAFDFVGGQRRSIDEKYGDATGDLKRLYAELEPLLVNRDQKVAAQ